jgi:uncharacterized delta-60 repeat protein
MPLRRLDLRQLRFAAVGQLRLAVVLAPIVLLALLGTVVAAQALDPPFGEDGVVRTPFPQWLRAAIANRSKGPLVEDLALQRNGKVVAALASGGEGPYLGAARYRLDGSLDRSFGADGFARTDRFFGRLKGEAQGQAIAIQRGGKILLAGYREDSNLHAAPVLARLRPNGKPDRGFGSKGLVMPRLREKDAVVLHGVAVQRNGRIVAVGARNERRGGKPAGLVIAYRPDGRIDRRFGHNGRVAFPHRRSIDGYTALRDIVVLPGGKMLVVGYIGDRFLLLRLLPSGALDRGFDGDGKILIGNELGGCCPSDAALSLLPDGRLIALSAPLGGGQTLFRFHRNGKLDRSFGLQGAIRGASMRKVGSAGDVAIQGNGRIVVAGTAGRLRVPNRTAKFVISILRFQPGGKPDRSFGKHGVKYLPFGYSSIGAAALTLPDGSVVAGGGTQVLSPPGSEDRFEYELVLARLRR